MFKYRTFELVYAISYGAKIIPVQYEDRVGLVEHSFLDGSVPWLNNYCTALSKFNIEQPDKH